MLATKCLVSFSPDPKIEVRQKSLFPLGIGLSWFKFPITPIRSPKSVSIFSLLIAVFRILLGSRLSFGFRIGASFLFVILLGGCAVMKVEREVQSGRRAMQLGDSQAALGYFESAAQSDPDYLTDFTLLNIGIWSYVGMAQLEEGKQGKALASFKQAKQRHREDHFAKVFLGLLMSQDADRSAGKHELVDGLSGLGQWLDTTRYSTPRGALWDPGDYLAKEIGQTLKLLQAEEVNWQEINENVVTLARDFDDEIDEVKRDYEFEVNDDDGNDGKP